MKKIVMNIQKMEEQDEKFVVFECGDCIKNLDGCKEYCYNKKIV